MLSTQQQLTKTAATRSALITSLQKSSPDLPSVRCGSLAATVGSGSTLAMAGQHLSHGLAQSGQTLAGLAPQRCLAITWPIWYGTCLAIVHACPKAP
jgi:hypothetical protein